MKSTIVFAALLFLYPRSDTASFEKEKYGNAGVNIHSSSIAVALAEAKILYQVFGSFVIYKF